MGLIAEIEGFQDDIVEWRRDFHQHPEIGMQEVRTSGIVADLLTEWGITTHRGIGNTGVVGVIDGQGKGRSIGLRADMDALPIEEKTNLPFSSKNPGVMHACGHDAHTAMLLGAARYLAATRKFNGRVVLIFQPAEEGLGGARAMIADGLFERFPCDEIYGMHNDPSGNPNRVGVKPGMAMAGADFFDIHVRAAGSHAAMPHQSIDPVVIASTLVQQLQTVVSRNAPPTEPLVLSVTQIHAGSAYNVIPSDCTISGTMRSLCDGVATGYGIEVEFNNREIFDVLVNDDQLSQEMLKIAADVVGPDNVTESTQLRTGSEDFADMLRVVPGAYCRLGHEGTLPLHNDGFFLGEEILPVGASIYARIAEQRCSS